MINEIDSVLKRSKDPKIESTVSLENETSINEKSFAEEKLEGLKQDREERKKYARITFQFLCVFTGIVMMIIIFVGGSSNKRFYLSDNVLITLITTSLSTVVGIFILVMRYLFR